MAETPPYDIEVTRLLDAQPEEVYRAFADADQFAAWYGPNGFPVDRSTVEIDPRGGGRVTFTMVGEADPSMRTRFDGRFTEVVANELLASTGAWDGIPGQADRGRRTCAWRSVATTAGPGSSCAKGPTRRGRSTWAVRRGR